MDATTAPHLIPPEMLQYGEDNHIFEMMQNMLEQVLIHQPEDPIIFMINHLRRNNDSVPKVVILGPPASGKTTIAMWLCKHLNSNLITKENLLEKEFSQMAKEAKRHYEIYKERETSATQQEQMEAVPLCMSQEESSSSLQPPDENALQCAGL
ncbi:Adenylate kinase 8 [Microtus ochrogaster]|uniref:Adenylate kinase 8 n=1 Tax=Microtus ochrogaster TaxID=79684 RepID=A0A8J6G4C3_MICOH|nr:Adenylate kinase 8 [Microtus ochrogaster]